MFNLRLYLGLDGFCLFDAGEDGWFGVGKGVGAYLFPTVGGSGAFADSCF